MSVKGESKPKLKVVVRSLPFCLSEQEFIKTISNFMPNIDYYYYVMGKKTLKKEKESLAYLHFTHGSHVLSFYQAFEGHAFVDQRGKEYKCSLEYAPYQRIPKKLTHGESKVTLEEDADFLKFVEQFNKPPEFLPSAEVQYEERKKKEEKERNVAKTTPILEELKSKAQIQLKPKLRSTAQKRINNPGRNTKKMTPVVRIVDKSDSDKPQMIQPTTILTSRSAATVNGSSDTTTNIEKDKPSPNVTKILTSPSSSNVKTNTNTTPNPSNTKATSTTTSTTIPATTTASATTTAMTNTNSTPINNPNPSNISTNTNVNTTNTNTPAHLPLPSHSPPPSSRSRGSGSGAVTGSSVSGSGGGGSNRPPTRGGTGAGGRGGGGSARGGNRGGRTKGTWKERDSSANSSQISNQPSNNTNTNTNTNPNPNNNRGGEQQIKIQLRDGGK